MPHEASTEPIEAAAGFRRGRGPATVLVIHGFGGTPYDFHRLAEHLSAGHIETVCPLLPGHGRGVEALRQAHVDDWEQTIDEEIGNLRAHGQQVLLLGTSFGGALALAAAARHADVAGVVLVNPALRYKKVTPFVRVYLRLRSVFSWYIGKPGLSEADKQRARISGSTIAWPIQTLLESDMFLRQTIPTIISRVRVPILLLQSANDSYVDAEYSHQTLQEKLPLFLHVKMLQHDGHRPFRSETAVQQICEMTRSFIKTVCLPGKNVV